MRKRCLLRAGELLSLVLLALVLGDAKPALAQQPQPPGDDPNRKPHPTESRETGDWDHLLQLSPEGQWLMPAAAHPPLETSAITPQATGGPDDFGYTWSDSGSLSWIDATSGTDTGLGGNVQVIGAVSLPFPFKFYENTYNQIYISKYGYAAFTNIDLARPQGRIPDPDTPNNIIAPYWVPTLVNEGGYTGRVYYASGGAAPNRYFVIEWYRVRGDYLPDENIYTFEAVLYENGDILLQHATMTYGSGWSCGHVGIEDSAGLDGLGYGSFCQGYPSYGAIRFYRPSPSARVQARPAFHGSFARAGELVSFLQRIRNTGEKGTDTYDLSVSSSWPVQLYAANGVTLLTDTDGDRVTDTGPLAQAGEIYITVKMQVPTGSLVGDDNTAVVTIRSSIDTTKQKTATFQAAIPAAFAQVFRDNVDGAQSFYLIKPTGQTTKKVAFDSGYQMAVAEAPNHNFVYAWSQYHWTGSVSVYEIEYVLLNQSGDTVRGVSKLADHSSATVNTYDEALATAIAPNGRIGMLWYRYLYDSSDSTSNYNVYYAVLDASGNLVVPPTNLTNNSLWGYGWATEDFPWFGDPTIAATTDNRFVLAWWQGKQIGGGSVDDIYYTVRDTSGAQVRAITRLTSDTTGSDDAYYYPNLATLSGSRAILSWTRSGDYADIYYAVLDSSGNTVKTTTNLSGDGTGQDDWKSDATQLSDGKTVVAWTGNFYPDYRIRFAVLDTNYSRVSGPATLNNPAATAGNAYVSVAPSGNNAALTWMDYNSAYRYNLYYALVRSDGAQITPPQVFRASQASSPYIETGFYGQGNTSHQPLPSPPTRSVYLPLLLRQPSSALAAPSLSPITPPEDNPSYTVRWSTVAGANSYVLERATSSTFGDTIQVYTGPATEHIAASAGIVTYSYRVKARSASGDSAWSNVQAVPVRWELEPNDEAVDATRTGPLQTGLYHYGVLTGADVRGNDYFYFDLPSNQTVELWLTHMAGGQDFNLVLRDASLKMVPNGYSGNPDNADEHIVTATLPPARYYVQVNRVTGDSSQPYHLWGAW